MKKKDFIDEQRKGLRTWIEIDSSALKKNFETFRKLKGRNGLLMGVVKSNAYGHGLIETATLLSHLGISWIGVDSITEALALRENNIRKQILVLGYTLPERLADALHNNISLTISSMAGLQALEALGPYATLNIHLKVDTGMHRQGFLPEELPAVLEYVAAKLPHVHIEGIYTHFAAAKDPNDRKDTDRQIKKFEEALAYVKEKKLKIIRHASATGATLLFPQARYDLLRIGIGMYGLWPAEEVCIHCENKVQLSPILSWRTIVSEVKQIRAEESVGYNFTERVSRDTLIAILPIGYWHGYSRVLSSIGRVLVRGARAKVLGRISMDMTAVDVTDIMSVKVGDVVTLIGTDGKEEVSADELAERCGKINYEIVTELNPRIKRIVV
ncbi:MAG: alanine racemase [Parcubacteria group bacterium Gr01-1014_48]|nr:MAG: alanine racemase [Parcubacteria group bacterium Greene0416_14]TSC73809.1 MAG: alanine racemase [Parcubacteria group bacterium Gr01-1014_48]TSD01073.1 MAG: alanine racemase [Parcubacteria group bacterium Greene1014_15]TSD08064.1 MAG: alanine racemase [Parcubacteria group bacterium Greene0714_4]